MGHSFFSLLPLICIWTDATDTTHILVTQEISVSLCLGKEHSLGTGRVGLEGLVVVHTLCNCKQRVEAGVAKRW